jgi:hypothetical protein
LAYILVGCVVLVNFIGLSASALISFESVISSTLAIICRFEENYERNDSWQPVLREEI